jgi:hypothetical protein
MIGVDKMNNLLQKRNIRLIMLITLFVMVLIISPTTVSSQVGPEALMNCEGFAFSTSEDFVTQVETPDDNPIISDGDLLGPDCTICARNADLMQNFDVNEDLGLDAVDVINVENYLVALSTELDSPNTGQFTAGDLLITRVTIIPNQALTYLFEPTGAGIPYDLGLDAVHFVGAVEDIEAFLAEAGSISRADWLDDLKLLSGMLGDMGIDIWFSTEGTYGDVEQPVFLDGDMLSAATGTIKASNFDLVLSGIPPDQWVDFGLDAVTSDRTSMDVNNIHFSTEILFESDFSFTDGDILRLGSSSIVMTNEDLVGCFKPGALMLGLDAVHVGAPEEPGCTSQLTRIGGVDVADISPTDGTINSGVLPGIGAPAPFGGTFEIQGTICDDVDQFRVVYRKEGTSDPWESMKVLGSKDWKVKVDAFLPPYPDCLGIQNWSSYGDGWFDAADYRHLSEAALGGCNPDLALTVWESASAVGGPEALYEVMLVTESTSMTISDTVRLVQLDNTQPIVELEKDAGTCNTLTEGDFPYMVDARMKDDFFHKYQLKLSGDSYGIYYYLPVAYYDDLTDNVEDYGTVLWNNYVGLHEVSLADLVPNPVHCGYTVWLTGWDRTLVGDFNYPSNFASRCAGCRHTNDIWTFNYAPAP